MLHVSGPQSRRPGRQGAIGVTRIDDDLLKIMECPVGHAPLVQIGDWLYSTDSNTRRKYPIRDGIPIMLIEESQDAGPEEFARVMAEHRS